MEANPCCPYLRSLQSMHREEVRANAVRRLKPMEGAGGLPLCRPRTVLPAERDRPVAAADLAGQADLPRLPGAAYMPGVGAAEVSDRRHLGRQHTKRATRAARSTDWS